MQSFIRFIDGSQYPVDHLASVGDRLVVNVLGMNFMTAYELFSNKRLSARIIYNDGKRDHAYEGFTNIESISEDDMGGVHVWLRRGDSE